MHKHELLVDFSQLCCIHVDATLSRNRKIIFRKNYEK
jgi:hypothetical protein